MSPKKKIEHLLDGLLAVPEWYAAILLAQLPPRELLPLLKQTWERSDIALREWVKGHSVEEVPELLRVFRESRLCLLEVKVENELLRVCGHLTTRELMKSYFFLIRQPISCIEFLRRTAKSTEVEPRKASPAIRAKAMRRPIPRLSGPPRRRSPRSSAQQIGPHARALRPGPSGRKTETTK